MSEEKILGIGDIIAAGAVVLLFWWFFRKKPSIKEPVMEEPKDQFSADPDFNMKDYCQNVVYRPLASSDLLQTNLMGKGWCYKGDRSAIDDSKGFGDSYADKQAASYAKMKQDEAIFINNKLCVQFRLINSTAAPITTDVLNVTGNNIPFNPIPDIPVANSASGTTSSGLTANWSASLRASGYYIDVATDIDFLSFVNGYQNKDVGNVLSSQVVGLIFSTTYYYRIRAYGGGVSGNSNIISETTSGPDEEIIGTQTWLKQNVDYNLSGSSVYNDNEANRSIYGGLYHYDMISAINALYPGYHVPTYSEFVTLRTFLGGGTLAGGKMKETGFDYWDSPNTGADNSSGWSARGSGLLTVSGHTFQSLKVSARYLIDTVYVIDPVTQMWYAGLEYNSNSLSIGVIGKGLQISIRLIKD